MLKSAPPVRRVVDFTRLAGFVALLLLFAGFFVAEFLLAWRFMQSARDVASLFNIPVIVLAIVVGFALGSFWERRS
jgi:H+/Cl- antiporter ClcA